MVRMQKIRRCEMCGIDPAEPVQQLALRSNSSGPTSFDNRTFFTQKAAPDRASIALKPSVAALDTQSAFQRRNMACELDTMREIWNAIPGVSKGTVGVLVGNGVLFSFIWLLTLCFRFWGVHEA